MTRADDALACFDDFAAANGETGQLNSQEVSVFIQRRIDVQDREGNLRNVAALVWALKAGFPAWSSGDLLTLSSGNVRLHEILSDDGYMQRIEALPQ